MIHGKNVCLDCEALISQCRCIEHNTTVHTVCEDCVKKRKERRSPVPEIFAPTENSTVSDLAELAENLKKQSALVQVQFQEIDRYKGLFYTYYSHYRILRDAIISYACEPGGERAQTALKLIQSLEGNP